MQIDRLNFRWYILQCFYAWWISKYRACSR